MYTSPSNVYFHKIQEENGFCVYEKAQNKKLSNPLVLFSEINGTALASLHFKLSDRYNAKNDVNARTIIAPLIAQTNQELQRFQGLINKENQEFEYVITNLSPKGYINFNLMKTNENVTKTNPDGINEINELRPFESYAIKCDQINNMPMILQKYKDDVGNTMTVEKDEKEQKDTKKDSNGTMIYVNVAPQDKYKELVALFERTTWMVAELIPIKCTETVTRTMQQYGGNYGHMQEPEPETEEYIVDESFSLFDNENENSLDGYKPGLPGPQGQSVSVYQESRSYGYYPHGYYLEPEPEEENCVDLGFSLFDDENMNGQNINQKIMESELGKVAYGDAKIEVNGYQSDIMYDYTKTSRPCVLGLSINENLGFVLISEEQEIQKYKEMEDDAKKMLKNLINKEFDEFLKGKIYEAVDCVICLTEGCDCVLFECGHKCGHSACLQTLLRCPVCRSHVSAKINLGI